MSDEAFSIYNYTDVRFFLRAFYKYSKKKSKAFSYRQFAARADLSPSLFQDVIAGRRLLTELTASKFSRAMKLGNRQSEYLLWMARFARAKTSEDKNEAFNQMCHYRGRAHMKFLAEDSFEFYSKWYHGVIRLMVSLKDFREDPVWIASRLNPPVGIRDVKHSLALLQNLKLLERDKTGKLQLSHRVLSTDYELDSYLVRRFNHEMIGLGARACEEVAKEDREVSSLQVSVSAKMFHRYRERLRIFKEELLAMAVEEKDDAEELYQLNLQLFPLLQKKEELS